MEKKDKRKTHFWIARYFGLSNQDSETQKNPEDLGSEIKKLGLTPSAFLSNQYDEEFIDWFKRSSYANWGIDDAHVREKSGLYEIRAVSHQDYFLTITASPELLTWYISGNVGSPVILAAGSFALKPLIFSGKIINRDPLVSFPAVNLEIGKRYLLYVWPPEFYDLDSDGIPEVWIRYNITSLNGFSQILSIYKIQNDNQLLLFKKFKSDNEGVARRLEGNKIQIGWGFGSKPNLSHMSYDRYHLETWEFMNGGFEKISDENTSHILLGKEWKKYYLDEHESWTDKYKTSI